MGARNFISQRRGRATASRSMNRGDLRRAVSPAERVCDCCMRGGPIRCACMLWCAHVENPFSAQRRLVCRKRMVASFPQAVRKIRAMNAARTARARLRRCGVGQGRSPSKVINSLFTIWQPIFSSKNFWPRIYNRFSTDKIREKTTGALVSVKICVHLWQVDLFSSGLVFPVRRYPRNLRFHYDC